MHEGRLPDIEEDTLVQVEDELRQKGSDVLSVRTDVSRMDDVESLAGKQRCGDAGRRRYGGVAAPHKDALV
jgi:hypothetical protein